MSTLLTRFKNFRSINPWQARLIFSFFIILIILSIIRISLSPTIIYSATSWLKKQGIDSSIEAIEISIFDGTISLINARGSLNSKPLFDIGLVDIHWDWTPLSKKTFEVTRVALDKFTVNIEQYSDKIVIGGVHLPADSTRTSEDDITVEDSKTATPWAATLGEVLFTDMNICYLQHMASFSDRNDETKHIDYCVTLDEMAWNGSISYATDKSLLNTEQLPLSSSGNFLLRGLNVIDNKLERNLLTSSSVDLNNIVINGLNNIQIEKLNMIGLSAMQRDDNQHIDAIRFEELAVSDIKLSNLNALDIGAVDLTQPGLYLVKENQTDWEYMQWLPPSPDSSSQKAGTKETTQDNTAAFSLAINRIVIDNSDFCYLEKHNALYYCFTLDNFDWNGSIKYGSVTPAGENLNLVANGDLSLSHPNIHNHNLQRNLIDFKSLTLNNMNVTDGTNLKLQELSLINFNALQRSEKPDDNSLSFDELKINDIKYSTNNIAINTIDLDGLASAVSKNRDGEWEHDKWLPKDNKEKNTPAANTKTAEQDKPDLKLSLNRINIISDKNITFTDNSTEPALTVGLQKLLFDISNLNSAKPDTDSTLKLQAKTSRHSTIDLAGTVRPFAEKISLDTSGKLKGFDLRAASPATKKAIGHIIKSGQLDADLVLRATDGVLDSNIALSLYQFNIKPMSKADAEALDKKFGMPLNKTLVLLRDKDDSIHLDIPITGDINNPAFNPYDAIIKATSKAATVTLITFYTPYGLIYAGGSTLLNLATALNFDPVEFKPGSAELLDVNKEQLEKLAKLMTDKPQIHLTLCGITNQSDLYTLYPETKKTQAEKSASEIPLSTEQAAALMKLAADRQTNTKNYLINATNIEHNRLILCEPEHQSSTEAIAGVEINI